MDINGKCKKRPGCKIHPGFCYTACAVWYDHDIRYIFVLGDKNGIFVFSNKII